MVTSVNRTQHMAQDEQQFSLVNSNSCAVLLKHSMGGVRGVQKPLLPFSVSPDQLVSAIAHNVPGCRRGSHREPCSPERT